MATTEPAERACPLCHMVGGPFPKGNRPKSTASVQSGCPRCGYCY